MDSFVIRKSLAAEIENGMEAAEGYPFIWGIDDCTTWCADIIHRATGKDPAADFRGQYHDRGGAYALIGSGGLALGIRRRAKELGWRPVAVAEADVGDLGIVQSRTGQCCVLRFRPGWWIGRIDLGYALLPDKRVKIAWSVA